MRETKKEESQFEQRTPMRSELINLAEAKHYLEEKFDVRKSIWELKEDIRANKIRAEKESGKYKIRIVDLDSVFGYRGEEIRNGEDYARKLVAGWAHEEIFERILLKQYPNRRKADYVARGYKAALSAGRFDHIIKPKSAAKSKTEEKEKESKYGIVDIEKNLEILQERENSVRKLKRADGLGLTEELEEARAELVERKTILCSVREEFHEGQIKGLKIVLPVTKDKVTEGLLGNLYSYFYDNELLNSLSRAGIVVQPHYDNGFTSLTYEGKPEDILKILRRDLLNKRQPEGFSDANLEVRLGGLSESLLKQELARTPPEKDLAKASEVEQKYSAPEEAMKRTSWFSIEEVIKQLSAKFGIKSLTPRQFGAQVRHGAVEKKIIGGRKLYRIKDSN